MSNETPADALRLVPVDTGPNFSDSSLPLDMIYAGADAIDRATDDMANYVSGETIDWDSGMMAVAVYRAMLAAAPASPLPGGGWQDISTAPKDGTVVDLFYPERGRLTDATWGPTGWGRHEWRGSHTVRMVPSEKPTHWMPLPAAPTGDARNGKGEG